MDEVIVVAALLLLVGLALYRWLRTGAYRRPDEGGPLPSHWWVVPTAPLAGGLVAHVLTDRPWPVLLPYLALVIAGLALSAIDADVHRLPNALTLPLGPVVLVLLTGASVATDDLSALVRAGLATAVVGGGFVLVAFLLYGRSIGMGDAKLMLSVSPALAWLGWGHLLWGVWFGFVIGGLVALVLLLARRATLQSRLAFGPWPVVGSLLALYLL